MAVLHSAASGEVLAQLESGSLQGTAQDLSQRSYFAKDKRPENGGLIDFTTTAEEIGALVRGLVRLFEDMGGRVELSAEAAQPRRRKRAASVRHPPTVSLLPAFLCVLRALCV